MERLYSAFAWATGVCNYIIKYLRSTSQVIFIFTVQVPSLQKHMIKNDESCNTLHIPNKNLAVGS
jgi:hypothetical protein